MKARPADFNEEEVKKSPTFRKWMEAPEGTSIRYACREFIKGSVDDEERLMRRIMIARRNNMKDHASLKRAKELAQKQEQQQQQKGKASQQGPVREETNGGDLPDDVNVNQDSSLTNTMNNDSGEVDASKQQKKRRYTTIFTDAEIAEEMDGPAVVATRTYKTWKALQDGDELHYNHKFIKGKEGHDWLLRKNIWRRMKYRRDNRKLVEEVLKDEPRSTRPKRATKRPKATSTTTSATSKTNTTRSSSRKRKVQNNTAAAAAAAAAAAVAATMDGLDHGMSASNHGMVSTASQIVDQALLSTPAGVIAGMSATADHHHHHHHHPHHHASLESAAAEAAASIPPDPDTAAVVEAAVAAGESYANLPPYVHHHPLENDVDNGLGLALDAAARLAAAKSEAMETETDDAAVLAAAVAGQHHHQPLQVQPGGPIVGNEEPAHDEQVDDDDDVLVGYDWDGGQEDNSI
ncbi:MAG: hypothetical protein SGILL_001354 [Bacillariaceae sp.]